MVIGNNGQNIWKSIAAVAFVVDCSMGSLHTIVFLSLYFFLKTLSATDVVVNVKLSQCAFGINKIKWWK